MRIVKTTKKHFEIFIEASKSWIATFGLLGWEVDFSHEELEARGQCAADLDGRVARLSLSTYWSEKPTDDDLKLCAFHEAMELMLMPVRILAMERYTTEDALDGAIHGVIRRLENVVFKGFEQ